MLLLMSKSLVAESAPVRSFLNLDFHCYLTFFCTLMTFLPIKSDSTIGAECCQERKKSDERQNNREAVVSGSDWGLDKTSASVGIEVA